MFLFAYDLFVYERSYQWKHLRKVKLKNPSYKKWIEGLAEKLDIAEKEHLIGNVCVYNRKELVDVHLEQGQTKLPRKERQSLTHGLCKSWTRIALPYLSWENFIDRANYPFNA